MRAEVLAVSGLALCFLPPLVRLGLLNVQVERLRAYLDGNGPVGRLLSHVRSPRSALQ